MAITLGAVCNVFNEANALPGWLENATSWADHVCVYHAGPGGKFSTDGTMEILEKWKVPVAHGTIDDGFGVARTAAVRFSPCDWVFVMDADERLFPWQPVLRCVGESTPKDVERQVLQSYDTTQPNFVPSNLENLKLLGQHLRVEAVSDCYNHIAWLRHQIEANPTWQAVEMIRRHWHDFSFKRPTQNFHVEQDRQRRLVRNTPDVYFDPNVRMHEQLVSGGNHMLPNGVHGPFVDHFHCFFKPMEIEQRDHDVRIYNSVSRGERPPRE